MKKKDLIPSRLAKRGSTDQNVINSILDEALFCTVSYVSNGLPFSIPTSYVRKDNRLYIHGSIGSSFLSEIEKGIPVCVSVMLVDDLVVAKSAFNHSVNYRSVIVFSEAQKHDNYEEKYHFFKELTEKIVPKSWEYLRPMTESEVNKTMLLSFDLSKSSSKIRCGQAVDEPEDEGLSIWSGLIPLSKQRLEPISNSTSKDIPLPDHLKY